jgi:hypothetical protein
MHQGGRCRKQYWQINQGKDRSLTDDMALGGSELGTDSKQPM